MYYVYSAYRNSVHIHCLMTEWSRVCTQLTQKVKRLAQRETKLK